LIEVQAVDSALIVRPNGPSPPGNRITLPCGRFRLDQDGARAADINGFIDHGVCTMLARCPRLSGFAFWHIAYNGKLSCFFIGISTCLLRSIASARQCAAASNAA